MFHMSREIYDKIEELGRLVADSSEFKAMKLAKKASEEDPLAAPLLAEYKQLRQKLDSALEKEEPDFEAINAINRDMEDVNDKLQAIPAHQRYLQAKAEYDTLMQGISDVLQNVVDPQVQCSCRGNCDACPGCGQEE